MDARRDVRMQLFARDEGHCLLAPVGAERTAWGPCSGPWTPHHPEKAWKGGEYSLRALVTLCARHNSWVEDEPDLAWKLGLVVRNGETHDQAAERRHLHLRGTYD